MGTNVAEPGLLYEIQLPSLATRFIFDTGFASASTQPNAQAWDDENGRFFYATVQVGDLYVWLKSTNDQYLLGNLPTLGGVTFPDVTCNTCGLASAAYWDENTVVGPGAYYIIPDQTDELWKVDFVNSPFAGRGTPPGIAIDTDAKVTDLTAAAGGMCGGVMVSANRTWQFGDIAVNFNDDVLYGSGLIVDPACTPSDTMDPDCITEFFKYDLMSGVFTCVKAAARPGYPLVQLTFNQPFTTLYAFNATDGEVFTVDVSTGDYSSIGTANVRFRDVGGASAAPIPVRLMDFTVTDQ